MLRKPAQKSCFLNVEPFYVKEVRKKPVYRNVEPFYVKEGRQKTRLS